MKRSLLLGLALLGISLGIFAQFKVHSNGKISFNITQTPLSDIALNNEGSSGTYIYYRGDKNALNCNTLNGSRAGTFTLKPSGSALSYTCLSSIVNTPVSGANMDDTYSFGVFGYGGYGAKNYGVLGGLLSGNHGAGIVGCTSFLYPDSFDKNYAGYFQGDVKVTSNLSVNGSISGVLLGAAITSNTMSQIESSDKIEDISSALSLLDVSSYQQKPEIGKQESKRDLSMFLNDSIIDESTLLKEIQVSEDLCNMQKQSCEKKHFALNAEQLEKIFPDLVYEMEDGSKTINYVEIIPLLVQSVNELNARIAELEGKKMSRANETLVNYPSSVVNLLYQNKPNPFKEQTTIRFSLVDNVQSASICIFDMTGKMLMSLPVSSGDTYAKINGWELGEGMFLYTLIVNGKEIDTKRMIVTK